MDNSFLLSAPRDLRLQQPGAPVIKLETQPSVPSSASVFTFIGAPASGGGFHSSSPEATRRKQHVCVFVCAVGSQLPLLLEQNFFHPCVFTFFLSVWSHSGEAPVDMVLRGE